MIALTRALDLSPKDSQQIKAALLNLEREDNAEEEEELYRARVLKSLIDQRLRFHEIDRFGFSELPIDQVERQFDAFRDRFGREDAIVVRGAAHAVDVAVEQGHLGERPAGRTQRPSRGSPSRPSGGRWRRSPYLRALPARAVAPADHARRGSGRKAGTLLAGPEPR